MESTKIDCVVRSAAAQFSVIDRNDTNRTAKQAIRILTFDTTHSRRYIDDELERRNFGCFQFKASNFLLRALFLAHAKAEAKWVFGRFFFSWSHHLLICRDPTFHRAHYSSHISSDWFDVCDFACRGTYRSQKPPLQIPTSRRKISECIISMLACSVISSRALPLSRRHFRHVLAPTSRQPKPTHVSRGWLRNIASICWWLPSYVVYHIALPSTYAHAIFSFAWCVRRVRVISVYPRKIWRK